MTKYYQSSLLCICIYTLNIIIYIARYALILIIKPDSQQWDYLYSYLPLNPYNSYRNKYIFIRIKRLRQDWSLFETLANKKGNLFLPNKQWVSQLWWIIWVLSWPPNSKLHTPLLNLEPLPVYMASTTLTYANSLPWSCDLNIHIWRKFVKWSGNLHFWEEGLSILMGILIICLYNSLLVGC